MLSIRTIRKVGFVMAITRLFGREAFLGPLTLAVVFALAACGGAEVSPANFERVQTGMTLDQVEDLLGPPSGTQSLGNTTFVDWKTDTMFIRLTVRNGVVEKKITRDPNASMEVPEPPAPIMPESQVVPGASNFQQR